VHCNCSPFAAESPVCTGNAHRQPCVSRKSLFVSRMRTFCSRTCVHRSLTKALSSESLSFPRSMRSGLTSAHTYVQGPLGRQVAPKACAEFTTVGQRVCGVPWGRWSQPQCVAAVGLLDMVRKKSGSSGLAFLARLAGAASWFRHVCLLLKPKKSWHVHRLESSENLP
jgi:hypothetical protein